MSETTALWITGVLSFVAILAAPLAALWVQRRIEEGKALRDRRQAIFKALWVNRRRQFWIARIDALNMIDVEFVGKENVLSAWRALFADYVRPIHPGMNDEQISNAREEMFATLLYEISQVLKYKFDRTYVRDNIYLPKLHSDMDVMELETRNLINKLLKLDALPVHFVSGGNPAPMAATTTVISQTEANTTELPDSRQHHRLP